jgi:hypothetical protein
MKELKVDFSENFPQLIYFEISFSKLYSNHHVFILNKNFKEILSITETERYNFDLDYNLDLKQFKIEVSK